MKPRNNMLATLAGCSAALVICGVAAAQGVNDKPLTENWAPSEFGADDKVGAPNRTTPEIVLKAMKLVKQGKTATLGKLYAQDVPFFGPRGWNITIPGTPTGGPFGSNALVYHDELVTTEIGQVSTQFDGPGHIGVRTSKGDFFYNGRIASEIYTRGAGGRVTGVGPLGVEFVAEKGFVCRGVLLDAPAYKGMNPLPIPKTTDSPGIVTADDVKAMVERQGLDPIGEGDCVFLYTGHGDLWKNADYAALSPEERAKRAKTFTSGEPGFGRSACAYMAERKIILTGGDTSANDAQPVGEIEGEAVPCHTEMQTRLGIWNIENLEFTPLLEDGVYEFLFVWSPLKIVGGTGSPGNPVVLY
ncbi:MAG: cyclase family protein [Alphaproteobacteria bacterium]|nr:cyclase family protein [Alphaproteobacteria bacterium]